MNEQDRLTDPTATESSASPTKLPDKQISKVQPPPPPPPFKADLVGAIPFALMHVAAVCVIFVEFHWWLVALGVVTYYIRAWGLTGAYHRYFAHRSYKTSRVMQFVIGFIGTLAGQKGPLWWAGHHRHHHRWSDTPSDVHSPVQRGFWYSHIGWILDPYNDPTRMDLMKDFDRFWELKLLNKYALVPPAIAAVAIYFGFEWTMGLGAAALMWIFFLPMVLLYHATFSVNSLNHVWGSRRYESGDDSRNNLWIALATGGEGWHNNHHHYQTAARNGFAWYEVDLTYYGIRVLKALGLVWDVKEPPERVLIEGGLMKGEDTKIAQATPATATATAPTTVDEADEPAKVDATEKEPATA